jgi:hypothetical protein
VIATIRSNELPVPDDNIKVNQTEFNEIIDQLAMKRYKARRRNGVKGSAEVLDCRQESKT